MNARAGFRHILRPPEASPPFQLRQTLDPPLSRVEAPAHTHTRCNPSKSASSIICIGFCVVSSHWNETASPQVRARESPRAAKQGVDQRLYIVTVDACGARRCEDTLRTYGRVSNVNKHEDTLEIGEDTIRSALCRQARQRAGFAVVSCRYCFVLLLFSMVCP